MSGPYQQGPHQPGPYQQGPHAFGYGPAPARYTAGIGLVVGLLGLVCAGFSLFVLSWADGSKGAFTDLSSAARKAGSDEVGNTALYLYLAWAGYVLFAAALILTVLALLPLPASAVGNTYARVGAAVAAGGAAILHIWSMHKLFQGDATPHFGAWLGLLGYLAVLVATIVGARRVIV